MAVGNSVFDEIKEQHQKVMESQGVKGVIQYFFYYYKWYALSALLVLVIGGWMIYDVVTQKDVVLSVAYINAFPNTDSEAFMDGFEETITINKKKEDTTLTDDFYIDLENGSYFDQQNTEKLLVLCAAGTVDVCVLDDSYIMNMAQGGYFLDLSTLLTEEQMTEYGDRLLWYDDPEDDTDGKGVIAIEITDAPKIVSTQSYPNRKCYFTIIVNSEHVDNSMAFLDYLETP